MQKIIIACPSPILARVQVEAAGVDPCHPRLIYLAYAEGVMGSPIGVAAVDLTAVRPGVQATQLQRALMSCLPILLDLSALDRTLVQMDEDDAAGAEAVARDRARALTNEVAAKREKADRYAARANAHENRHEYTEAVKLRAWARRERAEAVALEASGAPILSRVASGGTA